MLLLFQYNKYFYHFNLTQKDATSFWNTTSSIIQRLHRLEITMSVTSPYFHKIYMHLFRFMWIHIDLYRFVWICVDLYWFLFGIINLICFMLIYMNSDWSILICICYHMFWMCFVCFYRSCGPHGPRTRAHGWTDGRSVGRSDCF